MPRPDYACTPKSPANTRAPPVAAWVPATAGPAIGRPPQAPPRWSGAFCAGTVRLKIPALRSLNAKFSGRPHAWAFPAGPKCSENHVRCAEKYSAFCIKGPNPVQIMCMHIVTYSAPSHSLMTRIADKPKISVRYRRASPTKGNLSAVGRVRSRHTSPHPDQICAEMCKYNYATSRPLIDQE